MLTPYLSDLAVQLGLKMKYISKWDQKFRKAISLSEPRIQSHAVLKSKEISLRRRPMTTQDHHR